MPRRAASADDPFETLECLLPSFRLALQAENKSRKTIATYLQAVEQLDRYLAANALPRSAPAITADHIRRFIAAQLGAIKRPATPTTPVVLYSPGEVRAWRGPLSQVAGWNAGQLHKGRP